MIRINSNMKTTFQYLLFLLFMCGVFGVNEDRVSVMEGDSVTLNSHLTEIQTYRRILWRFGTGLSTIAQIAGGKITYSDNVDGRLQLDKETASLTITNMRMKHSGRYKLEAVSSSETTTKEFIVDVYETQSTIQLGKVEVKSMSEMEGNTLTLQTDVPQLHGDELIVWRFGDKGKLIAKCDIEAKKSTLYDYPDGTFRDRLQLNDQTGSLTITKTRTTDSGLYTVKVSSSKKMLYKLFTVIVSGSGLSPGVKTGIAIAVLVLVVFGVVLAILLRQHCLKHSKLKQTISNLSELIKKLSKTSEDLKQLSKTSEQLNQLSKDCKEEISEISEQLDQLSEISEQLSKWSKNSEKEMSEINEQLKRLYNSSFRSNNVVGARTYVVTPKEDSSI